MAGKPWRWMAPIAAMALSASAWAGTTTQPVSGGLDPELRAPVKLTYARGDIDADGGYAAPCFGDIDGDGVKDLLVGQFIDGSCRIYRNIGSNDRPKFANWVWLHASGDYAHVGYG